MLPPKPDDGDDDHIIREELAWVPGHQATPRMFIIYIYIYAYAVFLCCGINVTYIISF